MSSLLPSLPTAPVIRQSTELHSDPCCDKAEQVKREIETLIDLNLPRTLIYATEWARIYVPVKSLGGRAELPGRSRRTLVRRCLLSSSRAVFLALAEVNHSTLTIFALPLYKHRGTRPTDPITSLSGNKCLTIQPYWVWEINPFHSRAPAHFLREQARQMSPWLLVFDIKYPNYMSGRIYWVFARPIFCFYFFIFPAAIVTSFCCFIFHIFVSGVCVCVCVLRRCHK